MTSDAVERRLAAILSADAVGYSRLMAADEAATVQTLGAHRRAIEARVRDHGGGSASEIPDPDRTRRS